jgi:hypothetical protein
MIRRREVKIVRRMSLVAVALVCAGTLGTGPATAHHTWNVYHWGRAKNPVALKIGDNADSSWDSYLKSASSDWGKSSVFDSTIVDASGRGCKPKTGIVRVCAKRYGTNGWAGQTTLYGSDGVHITAATVQLNETYLPSDRTAHRQMAMCHEIGPALGLAHQDGNHSNTNLGSCMDLTNKPAGPPSNEHPNTGDYDQLLCIYDPAYKGRILSSGSHTCLGTGHLDTGFAESEAPGEPVGPVSSVTDHLYVQDLDSGGKRFIWVSWVKAKRGTQAALRRKLICQLTSP